MQMESRSQALLSVKFWFVNGVWRQVKGSNLKWKLLVEVESGISRLLVNGPLTNERETTRDLDPEETASTDEGVDRNDWT